MSGIQRKSVAKILELDRTPLIVRLPVSSLVLDPNQPRQKGKHTPEKIASLGKSMKRKQLQPITVREIADDQYMVVIGEGRTLGARAEQLEFVDCIITSETDSVQIKLMQIAENLHRADMDPLDYAMSYKELLDLGVAATAKEVADMCDVSDATVSVLLQILDAPEEVKSLVQKKIATPDTARTLLDVQQRDPDRAAALIEQGNADGKLKREVVRAAQHELKAKAGEVVQPKKKVPSAPAPAPVAPTGAQQTDSRAPVDESVQRTTPQAAQGPAEADTVDTSPPAAAVPSAVAGPAPAGVPAHDVFVDILSTAVNHADFNLYAVTYGAARLAPGAVHENEAMAWVVFGVGDDVSEPVAYPCADLLIRSVRPRV